MENRNKNVWLSGLFCAIIRANLLIFHFIPGKFGANNRVVWLSMVWLSGLCCMCTECQTWATVIFQAPTQPKRYSHWIASLCLCLLSAVDEGGVDGSVAGGEGGGGGGPRLRLLQAVRAEPHPRHQHAVTQLRAGVQPGGGRGSHKRLLWSPCLFLRLFF